MVVEQLKNILESAIFAADEPLSIKRMRLLFDESDCPTVEEFSVAIEILIEDYGDKGIELKEVSSGFRFQVKSDYSSWVSRLWDEKPAKYSRALMETLALMAYRQPITRSEIEDIRGVSVSSYIIKTLSEREWIRIVGHKDVPGRPALFATTKEFLDYFNLKSLEELPALSELLDLDKIEFALGMEAVNDSQIVDSSESENNNVVDSVQLEAANDNVNEPSLTEYAIDDSKKPNSQIRKEKTTSDEELNEQEKSIEAAES